MLLPIRRVICSMRSSACHFLRPSTQIQFKRKTHKASEADDPVKFSSSKAHSHSSFDTFLVKNRSRPWYQPVILCVSTAVFLLYFAVLREENDWDEELKLSLYERIPGLKEKDEMAKRNLYNKK